MGVQDDSRELLHADAALPPVNTLLRLLLGEGRGGELDDALTRVAQGQAPDAQAHLTAGLADLPTRVEDVVPAQRRGQAAQVVVSAPRYAGDVEGPSAGMACALVWATQRGVVELPTRYSGARTLNQGLRVWTLDVAGPAVRLQRRAFVRVPVSVPLTVRTRRLDAVPAAEPEAPDDGALQAPLPETLQGRTLDVSEGGVRCLLPSPALPADLPVEVAFTLDGDLFDMRAEIVRCLPPRVDGRGGTGMVETAIRFVEPGQRGDDLRRVVFAQQLRLRRSGLG